MSAQDFFVVNRVLNVLGRKSITDISEDEWALVIKEFVTPQLRILLSDYNWSWAVRWETLNKNTIVNNPSYNFSYVVPQSMERLIAVYRILPENTRITIDNPIADNEFIFEDEIYSNEDGIWVRYITNNIDLSKRSAVFIEALSYLIASEVIAVLLNDESLVKFYAEKSLFMINKSQTIDNYNWNNVTRWQKRRNLY